MSTATRANLNPSFNIAPLQNYTSTVYATADAGSEVGFTLTPVGSTVVTNLAVTGALTFTGTTDYAGAVIFGTGPTGTTSQQGGITVHIVPARSGNVTLTLTSAKDADVWGTVDLAARVLTNVAITSKPTWIAQPCPTGAVLTANLTEGGGLINPSGLGLHWESADTGSDQLFAPATDQTTDAQVSATFEYNTAKINLRQLHESVDGGINTKLTIYPPGFLANGVIYEQLVPFVALGEPVPVLAYKEANPGPGGMSIYDFGQDAYDESKDDGILVTIPPYKDPTNPSSGQDHVLLYAYAMDGTELLYDKCTLLAEQFVSWDDVAKPMMAIIPHANSIFTVQRTSVALRYIIIRPDGTCASSKPCIFSTDLQRPYVPQVDSNLAAPIPNPDQYKLTEYEQRVVLSCTIKLNPNSPVQKDHWIQPILKLTGRTVLNYQAQVFVPLALYMVKDTDIQIDGSGTIVYQGVSGPLKGYAPADLYDIEESYGELYYLHFLPWGSGVQQAPTISPSVQLPVDTVPPHRRV